MMTPAVPLCLAAYVLLLCAPSATDELPEQYREPFADSFPIRKELLLQVTAYLDRLEEQPRESRDRESVV